MNTLVTGGGGFLGSYLVEQLVARGDQVRVFCRGHYPLLDELDVEMLTGDLRDRSAVQDACRGVDIVYHAAGVAGIWGPWHHYHGINTLGTANILSGCLEQGVRRLVYTSSPSVTFDGHAQEGVDEQAPYPTRWLCHYAHTKALAEQQVLAANNGDRLLTCALRPHLIWGPRDTHLIPRLLARARQGGLIQVGDGTNLVDTIYVENAAQAHLQAADALEPGSPVAGRAYFLSQGEPVNCWQWINELLALAELPPIRRSISLRVATAIGRACELTHWALRRSGEPRMTRFLARQLGTSHYFDIRRAQEDFGYSPSISTAEGMERLRPWLAGRAQ